MEDLDDDLESHQDQMFMLDLSSVSETPTMKSSRFPIPPMTATFRKSSYLLLKKGTLEKM